MQFTRSRAYSNRGFGTDLAPFLFPRLLWIKFFESGLACREKNMVSIQKKRENTESSLIKRVFGQIAFSGFILLLFWLIVTFPEERGAEPNIAFGTATADAATTSTAAKAATAAVVEGLSKNRPTCPYMSLDDLSDAELHPTQGNRHMVTPPADTVLTLVCCQTTAGPWNIVAHHSWAPLGASRFLQMVRADYFNTMTVPLFRCVPNFLCQFGLAGGGSSNSSAAQFRRSLADDPNWLPQGKDYRQNAAGVKRFAAGYLAYAGNGAQSRSNQLFVALKANGPLAGGSPWEVPWGELVGPHSFETLDKIFTGYGENGPKQSSLGKSDYVSYVRSYFPKLDWIESCHVVHER
jgi:peptidyl-prolyl cis-trans isomerase A (cyclophilin A)